MRRPSNCRGRAGGRPGQCGRGGRREGRAAARRLPGVSALRGTAEEELRLLQSLVVSGVQQFWGPRGNARSSEEEVSGCSVLWGGDALLEEAGAATVRVVVTAGLGV